MAVRDFLASEVADNRSAADAAAQGRSLTGMSGRHSDIESRVAGPGDRMFGGEAPQQSQPSPVVGERVAKPQMQNLGGISDLIDNDPVFRERSAPLLERKPFGNQEQVLAYPNRAGFRRYWFNDIPGRLQRAKDAGYAHVLDEHDGKPVARITDKADGRGRASYLMEIPIEWYQQDMARQAADLDRRLHDIRNGAAGPGAEDNRYVPKQGISITRSGR